MRKFFDSLESKPSSARLLGSSRENSSQGLNYQTCSKQVSEKEGRRRNKNGLSLLKKPALSDDDEKFHRIKSDDEDSKTRFLCVVGCCGGGRISLVWMSKNSLLSDVSNPASKGEIILGNNSNINKQEDINLEEVESLTPSKELLEGTSISDRQENCLDDPENSATDNKLGRIQFSIHYDFPEQTLTLRIIRASDLVAKDFSGTSDPYVKIMLLPDKKRKLMTNVKRKNLNPRWNEVFAFEGFPYTKLMNKTLYLQVLDYDRFSRDDPIGEVCISLTDFNLSSGQTVWKNLQPCKSHMGKLGELQVGLCYHPSNGLLTTNIKAARHLKAKDINGLSDPYVKIWFMLDGKKHEKKKTRIVEKSLNPQFEEKFTFNVPYEKIRQTSIMISVMDYDRMGRNEQIGQIYLGSKSGPTEVKHWNEMFSRTRQEVVHWHILKDIG